MKLSLLLLLFIAACNKNPYPDGAKIIDRPTQDPEEVRPAISADLPDNVEFKEGKETSVTFRAVVPKPGSPMISVEKLPDGAIWNNESMTLTWQPDFNAGNVANDPTVKVNIYPIVVWVRSSEDEVQAVRKSMNLVVYDQPRPINIVAADEFEVTEGETKAWDIVIDNSDYAQGPFEVSLGDFPANVVLGKASENNYHVTFSPDYQHVNVRRDSSCYSSKGACREYTSRVVVLNPAGHKVEKSVKIKVIDKRMSPKAVAQDELTQGLDVNFQIGGYDLNSEAPPTIELTSKRPEQGKFSIDTITDNANFSSVARITWSDLPPSMNGTITSFTFNVCSLASSSWNKNCVTKTVKVKVKIQERLAPVIVRASWTIGEMKYLNFKQTQEFKIDVFDQQDRGAKVQVDVFPESMRKYVRWDRNFLSVSFDKAGIYQFNLTATSQYGVKSVEGFVVEVFSENRGQALLLSDSSRDKEVQFYRKHFKNLEVVNPFLQDLGTRLLSGRKTLVVATSVLMDPESRGKVEEASKAIRDLVVASSMVQNLPDSLYRQITEDFRISIVGRYLSIPGVPELSTMTFITRQDFTAPKAPVSLMGLATTESPSPMVFSTGVDTENCDDVLEVSDSLKLNRYKLGIICDRPTGGRLVLLGTEWADLQVHDSADLEIPSKWLTTMLTANIKEETSEAQP